VYPLHCKRAGEDTWKLKLRCPDCERTWSRCAPTLEVRRFDRRLADDRRSLVEHLREIERIEREVEIERFSSALAADAILSDPVRAPVLAFARRPATVGERTSQVRALKPRCQVRFRRSTWEVAGWRPGP
jgi:hypothetical protein